MQGAGAKSWNRLSALFNKDDEHQLLEETESPPVADQWVFNRLSSHMQFMNIDVACAGEIELYTFSHLYQIL